MKLFFLFLFCFTNGLNPTKGQLYLELSGEMLLRFVFHPDYYFNEKSCCKFTSNGCIILVTSNGYVHNAFEGRIETYKYSGAFDVRIWNVHAKDAGIYRCEIYGIPKRIYQEFHVVITEGETELDPILDFPKSTILPVSSVDHLFENQQEISRNKWSLKFTLGTIFGAAIIILIISITLKMVKMKSRDKCAKSFPNAPSVTQLPQELIYTTVDFKIHQKTSEIYANQDISNSRPDTGYVPDTQDRVVYTTIAGVHKHNHDM